jgi:site-specific DNA-methyltransferase (adenine-specific)
MNKIILGDNLEILKLIPDNSIDLIWTDPPYNTGKKFQKRNKIKAEISNNGNEGFGGEKYKRIIEGQYGSFKDSFDDYIGFLVPRLEEAYRILKSNGTMYLHLDYREVHYAKIEMDKIFGRDNFINEIIWSYDYGAKSKTRWSAKHDNILYYVKNKNDYVFNYDKIPRIPYKAPKLVGPKKAALGKIVTDVWTETIVPTNSNEKHGYATQKPLRILNRIVEVSSNPGDLCLDFFAGSGSFGEACKNHDREFIMIDNNPEAVEIMKKRLDCDIVSI